jgi:hypothetical protein
MVAQCGKSAYGLGLLCCLILATGCWGQSTETQAGQQHGGPPANIGMPHQMAITGCLRHNTQPEGYYLTGENGVSWKLIPGENVDLSAHVLHSVTVTGKAANEAGEKLVGGETTKDKPVLRVLTLKVLSPSCTR